MTWEVVVIMSLITLSFSIGFMIDIEPLSEYCGYEHLIINAKYLFAVSPKQQHDTEVEVKTIATNQSPQQKIIYSDRIHYTFKISKLSPESNFYSFCIKNKGDVSMNYAVIIQTGLQLMDFSNTPDLSQKDLINHELYLLQNEISSLMSELQSIQHAKINTQSLFNMLSIRTFWFGIIGVVILGFVNFAFYYGMKKTLKQHKLA